MGCRPPTSSKTKAHRSTLQLKRFSLSHLFLGFAGPFRRRDAAARCHALAFRLPAEPLAGSATVVSEVGDSGELGNAGKLLVTATSLRQPPAFPTLATALHPKARGVPSGPPTIPPDRAGSHVSTRSSIRFTRKAQGLRRFCLISTPEIPRSLASTTEVVLWKRARSRRRSLSRCPPPRASKPCPLPSGARRRRWPGSGARRVGRS